MPELTRASPWPFVGMAGLACVLFLDLASLLFAPWWAVLLLVLVWVVLLVVATAWWTLHPRWVPGVPVVGVVVWLVVAVAGGAWLGWRA
ncbi:hypothetical protein [Nocardioides sp.]|uniref:hypothetical protein n=1 Tax=Nocardioides sp. TaxID=35761 RepID=UPI003782D822